MINQILTALRISLNECKKYEDPAEYIYQLNQVLNRYKTNLFKMIPNKELIAYDPKELFNFRIYGNWRLRPNYKRESVILDQSTLMLTISGIAPIIEERRNLEKNHNRSICVDDVIDIQRLARLKIDYYKGLSVGTNSDFKDEQRHLEEKVGLEKANTCSMYYNSERAADGIIMVSFQLNSIVYSQVLEAHQTASAERMADAPLTQREINRAEARAKLANAQPAMVVKKPEVVDTFFGMDNDIAPPLSAAALKSGNTPRLRSKNYTAPGNRSGHKFW